LETQFKENEKKAESERQTKEDIRLLYLLSKDGTREVVKGEPNSREQQEERDLQQRPPCKQDAHDEVGNHAEDLVDSGFEEWVGKDLGEEGAGREPSRETRLRRRGRFSREEDLGRIVCEDGRFGERDVRGGRRRLARTDELLDLTTVAKGLVSPEPEFALVVRNIDRNWSGRNRQVGTGGLS
jgi:hypothetical protein